MNTENQEPKPIDDGGLASEMSKHEHYVCVMMHGFADTLPVGEQTEAARAHWIADILLFSTEAADAMIAASKNP